MLFKHLFTPHEIRGLEIRNRIFSTAHQTILAEKGAPGEKMAAYHEARARGGAEYTLSLPLIVAIYYWNRENAHLLRECGKRQESD